MPAREGESVCVCVWGGGGGMCKHSCKLACPATMALQSTSAAKINALGTSSMWWKVSVLRGGRLGHRQHPGRRARCRPLGSLTKAAGGCCAALGVTWKALCDPSWGGTAART